MVYVFATIELAAGKRDEFLALQRELLPLVRAEQGCIEYVQTEEISLTENPKTPPRKNCIFMLEKWESLPALQAHLRAPHMNDFRETVKSLVTGIKVEVFESL
jgi:quinol monooxygenase YgiN